MATRYTDDPHEALAYWTATDNGYTTAIYQALHTDDPVYAIGVIDQMREAGLAEWELIAPEHLDHIQETAP